MRRKGGRLMRWIAALLSLQLAFLPVMGNAGTVYAYTVGQESILRAESISESEDICPKASASEIEEFSSGENPSGYDTIPEETLPEDTGEAADTLPAEGESEAAQTLPAESVSETTETLPAESISLISGGGRR